MTRLTLAEQLDRYRSYFPGPHLDLTLASMTAGNTAGELWTIPQGDTPPLLLLWDQGNNVFYLTGQSQLPSLESLAAPVISRIRSRAVAEGAIRFKARAVALARGESPLSVPRRCSSGLTGTLLCP